MADETDEEEDDFDTMIDDEFDELAADEEEGDVSAVMTPSKLLAVRRAIEARMERKQMDAALNYLELDFEDEE